MIKMKVTYKDCGLDRIMAAALRTNATVARVGVVGAKALEPSGADGRITNIENAVIQQFGLAPKHHTSRDFLDGPFANARTTVASILRRVMTRVLALNETPEQAMDWAGGQLEKIPRDAIMAGIKPRNKPATIDTKGFDHPLVDSLDLYDAISHQVVRENGASLEAGSALGDYESFEFSGGGLGGGE